LKVDPTRWKFHESCETTATPAAKTVAAASEYVYRCPGSRCHDLTNTTRHFRIEPTLENQIASVERSLPVYLQPALLPFVLETLLLFSSTVIRWYGLVQIREGSRSSPRSTFDPRRLRNVVD